MRELRSLVFPVCAVAAATLVRLVLEPVLDGRSPLVLYFIAVLLSAWRAGHTAGLVAAALSVVTGTQLFVAPHLGGQTAPATIQIVLFVLVALCIVWVTERIHRSQREVRLREERFRSLVDATTSIVWTSDADGGFVQRQPSWEAYTGQPWETHRGLGWHQAIHPDDRPEVYAAWRSALDRQIPLEGTIRLWHAASRAYRTFVLRAVPLFSVDGTVREWIGTCSDVDDQRRAEQALRGSEAEFKAMFELAGGAKTQLDALTGRIMRANTRFCELVGYTREELAKTTLLDLTHPEDRAATEANLRALVSGDIAEVDIEKRYVRKDGEIVWGHTAAAVLRNPAGHPTRIVASTQDITERKRQEQERERLLTLVGQQRSLLEAVLQQIPAGVMIADAMGRLVHVSEQVRQLTGIDVTQPMTLADYSATVKMTSSASGQARSPRDWPLARALRGALVHDEEIEIARESGPPVTIIVNAAPVRDEAGRIIAAVAAFYDVTDRKRVEAERERALDREREARSAAEQANRLKDDFLATISHELRTPLNAILGWADMLRAGMLDGARQTRAIESIHGNARRQAQLIEDLLDVSRIITGTVRLQVAPLDFGDVVHAAVDVVTPAAAARQITVRIEGASGVTLRGDAARLQQIVWNLLSNAVKFTPEGGHVTVRLDRSPQAITLTVTDNGMGIEPAFLPYVFDRFRQADSGTTRAFGGLGLGLAIVRHLAELHGGTVTAHSEGVGRGARFTVTLPAVDAPMHVPSVRPVVTGVEPARDAIDLHGVRVLIVEDERDTRELLSVALARFGAHVRAAASVTEALDELHASSPDVLVSDIGMPGRDGYELLQEIRGSDAREIATVPAIALTAYAKPEDRVHALASGFQAHLTKPLEPAQLARTIRSLLPAPAAGPRPS
jgi:PAS domain S-box-containing protein